MWARVSRGVTDLAQVQPADVTRQVAALPFEDGIDGVAAVPVRATIGDR